MKLRILTKYKILLVEVFQIVSICLYSQNYGHYSKMMRACSLFVENYKPTYIIGNDTLIVSRFTTPPDSINNFIFDCIKNQDLKPLKYAAVIFIKQNAEYYKVNKDDYFIGDGFYAKNGFVELMRYAMGITNEGCENYNFPYYTGEVCKWIKENRSKIDDYEYVENYFKK